MMQRDDIIARLRANLPELRRRYPIALLALFGSFARNEARDDSDLDVLVEFVTPIGLSQFLALEDEVAALTGRKVDLVSRRALKPHTSERVALEQVTV